MNAIEISIVLGSYNRKSFLKAAIESIRQNRITTPYEIIVVDGGSTDGSLKWLALQKDVITIIQHNRGSFCGRPVNRRSWGYFMNLGFKCTQGKYLVMISDDSLLVPGAIMSGLRHFEALRAQGRNIGAVAFYWRNWPEQQEYWVGLTLGEKMFVNHGMYLRAALEQVGWIDEARYQFYYADGDLCLKLWQAGYEVVDCPRAFVEHFTHANRKARQENFERERLDWSNYLEKWQGIFYDPDNPNSGSWTYLKYQDRSRTTRRFPKFHVATVKAASFVRNLKQVGRKFVKSGVTQVGLVVTAFMVSYAVASGSPSDSVTNRSHIIWTPMVVQ